MKISKEVLKEKEEGKKLLNILPVGI